MPHPLTRRSFLKATAGAGAMASFATTTGARRRAVEPPPERMVRPADALGAADAGRKRSRPLRPGLLARLLPPPARRCRHAQRRRHRRVLPHRGAAAPSQRVAWRQRPVRHAGRRLPRARHARGGADGPACGPRRGSRGAPGLDRRQRRRQPPAALGQQGPVGDLRPGSVQLRLHGRGAPRDRVEVPGGRHLRQPLGAAGRRLLLRALRTELQDGDRAGSAAPGCDRRGPARVCRVAHRAVDGVVEALGRDRALGESRGAIHPQRPAGSEDRR